MGVEVKEEQAERTPEQQQKFVCLGQAIKHCLDYIETFWGGVPASTDKAYTQYVSNWYNFTDIREPYTLAALALRFGDYKTVSCSEILEAVDYFFGEKEEC